MATQAFRATQNTSWLRLLPGVSSILPGLACAAYCKLGHNHASPGSGPGVCASGACVLVFSSTLAEFRMKGRHCSKSNDSGVRSWFSHLGVRGFRHSCKWWKIAWQEWLHVSEVWLWTRPLCVLLLLFLPKVAKDVLFSLRGSSLLSLKIT